MTEFPKLTTGQVRTRASASSYVRGQDYYRQGAIFDCIRRGSRLMASCEGSGPAPYQVTVELDEQGIVQASCTCLYHQGGDCKHIVALLLTYIHQPEAFTERPTIDQLLAGRDKNALITLIKEMLDRHPDLDVLLDRPLPGEGPRQTPVSTESFRRELRYAITHYQGWGDHTAEHIVYRIAKTAAQFRVQGDWRSARVIYSDVLHEGLQGEGHYFDDEGSFLMALDTLVDGLIDLLELPEVQKDEAERQAIFNSLLDAYIWNVNIGGYGLGGEIPGVMLTHATQQDLPLIRQRLEAALEKTSNKPYSQRAVETYERFLAKLAVLDDTDPEVILARLREKGLYNLLCERLIVLARFDEAVTVAAEFLDAPFHYLQVARLLHDAGKETLAVQLVEQKLQAAFEPGAAAWLIQHYKTQGDLENALRLQHRWMLISPKNGVYAALHETAEALGRWEEIRPEIITFLETKQAYSLLTQIYLYEENWDAAWETLEKIPSRQRTQYVWLTYHALDLLVAERSRFARPQKAIPVYVRYARQEIEKRGREQYRVAAKYLAVVRDLYRQIDDMDTWEALIADIRTEFKRLPALQDELNKAGL